MEIKNNIVINNSLDKALAEVTTFFPQSVIDVCKDVIIKHYNILRTDLLHHYGNFEARYICMAILTEVIPSVAKNRIQREFYPKNKSCDAINYALDYIRQRCLNADFRKQYELLREKVWSTSPFAPDWSFAEDVIRKRNYKYHQL